MRDSKPRAGAKRRPSHAVPAPSATVPISEQAHALTFFLSRDQRERVLSALSRTGVRPRSAALLRALGARGKGGSR